MFNKFVNSENGKIFNKVLAIILVLTLTFANYIFLGTYIAKGLNSYATEDNKEKEPSLQLSQKLITNKIYKVAESFERIVQIEIESKAENVQGTAEILIPATVIENKEPKNIKVTSYETEFGFDNNKIAFNTNNVNKFIATYVYEEQECIQNEESKFFEVKPEPKIVVEAISNNVRSDKNEEISSIGEKIEYTEAQFGDIVALTETVENLYKGNMYLGIDTQYSTNLKVEISYLNNGPEDLVIRNSNVVTATLENENIAIEDSIFYKNTIFNKEELTKLFNNDGIITVKELSENEEKSTVIVLGEHKDEEKEKYNTKYEGANIIYLSEKEENEIVIEHSENTKLVTVKTTAPQREGILNIKNDRVIIIDESLDINAVKKINSTVLFTTKENIKNETFNKMYSIMNTVQHEIKEPQTQITSSMEYINNNQEVITSLNEENEVKFTINLIAKEIKDKLFENSVIEINLPSNIQVMSIGEAVLALDDGLNIKSSITDGRKIIIELNGKQEKYNIDEVQQSISIFATLKLDSSSTSGNVNINVNCKNGSDEVIEFTPIIVAVYCPEDLIIMSNIKEGINVVNSVEEKNTMKIKTFSKEKIVNFEATLINNYGEKIENIELMGKIPEEKSTINSGLESEILLEGVENEIIYYEGENKTKDVTKATSYKIMIKKMEQADRLKISYSLTVPKNLGYNNSLITTMEANYNYIGEKISKNVTMEVTTGKGPVANISIVPETENEELNGGQILTYNIKVTNIGDEDIKKATLNYEVMENGQIINNQKEIDEDNNKAWSITDLIVEKEVNTKIKVKVDKVDKTTELLSKATVTVGEDIIALEEVKQKVQIADFEISMEPDIKNNNDLDEGSIITYKITAKNISKNDITNAIIKTFVPENTSFVEGYTYNKENGEKKSNCIKIENSDIVAFNIGNLPKNEEKIVFLDVKIEKLPKELNNEAEIKNYATIEAEGATKCQSDKTSSKVYTAEFEIHLNSPDKVTLNEYSDIKYEITVKNIGKRAKKVNIVDTFPELVSVNSINYYTVENDKKYTFINSSDFSLEYEVAPEETLTVVANGVIRSLDELEGDQTINNMAKLKIGENNFLESEIVTNILANEKIIENQEDISEEENKNVENSKSEIVYSETNNNYGIFGTAWLDKNKNGIKESEESLISEIEVMLIEAETGKIVLDDTGKYLSTITAEDGSYLFNKLSNGEYKVIFLYDTTKYQTTQRNSEVSDSINSHATSQTLTINGQTATVALTETISINNSSVVNINLGLRENECFDLSLTKNIKKVTVKNNAGTTDYNFENTDFTKVEIPGKNFEGSILLIEYEIVLKNEGDVTGFVTDILDYIPENLSFNSEMNTNWYIDQEGVLHNITISTEEIKAGEEIKEKLILTTTLNSEKASYITNVAEIGNAINVEGLEEKDSIPKNKKEEEDDLGKAELLVSIHTGGTWLYIQITLISLIVLSSGIYLIDKKVLKGDI